MEILILYDEVVGRDATDGDAVEIIFPLVVVTSLGRSDAEEALSVLERGTLRLVLEVIVALDTKGEVEMLREPCAVFDVTELAAVPDVVVVN